jgi:hypothetical protein
MEVEMKRSSSDSDDDEDMDGSITSLAAVGTREVGVDIGAAKVRHAEGAELTSMERRRNKFRSQPLVITLSRTQHFHAPSTLNALNAFSAFSSVLAHSCTQHSTTLYAPSVLTTLDIHDHTNTPYQHTGTT